MIASDYLFISAHAHNKKDLKYTLCIFDVVKHATHLSFPYNIQHTFPTRFAGQYNQLLLYVIWINMKIRFTKFNWTHKSCVHASLNTWKSRHHNIMTFLSITFLFVFCFYTINYEYDEMQFQFSTHCFNKLILPLFRC